MTDLISKRCKSCEIPFTAIHDGTTRCPQCSLGRQDYHVLLAIDKLYRKSKEHIRLSRNPSPDRAGAFERVNNDFAIIVNALGYASLHDFSVDLAKHKEEISKDAVAFAESA